MMRCQPENFLKAQGYVREVSAVTWVGLLMNALLCVLKITVGTLGNSQAVVADGVHSLADVVTDIAVLVGVRFWAAPATLSHPYGYQRLESLISLSIGILLFFAAGGVAYDALMGARGAEGQTVGSFLALGVMMFSMLSKEVLYRWTLGEGKKLRSSAVQATAWDHRSDAIASIPTALAVGISIWFPAYAIVDVLAAVLVAGFIFYAAWKICVPALNTLLDKGADQILLDKIIRFAMRVEGVKSLHLVRTRYLGTVLCIDLHAGVDGSLTVTEGNIIAHRLENAFYTSEAEKFLGVKIYDVLVHIDPAGLAETCEAQEEGLLSAQ